MKIKRTLNKNQVSTLVNTMKQCIYIQMIWMDLSETKYVKYEISEVRLETYFNNI